MTERICILGAVLCLYWCGVVNALPLWELEGARNRVHILGSVHFLRAQDYPLPDAIMSAFGAADVIVFELDLSELDPIAMQTLLHKMAIDPQGKSLESYLGARNWQSATTLAADMDIDLAAMQPYEPWFAALQITQLRLGQLGFDGSFGIETRLTLEAVSAGKEIRGLESLEDQFSALDSLPPPAQREFLMQTLVDAAGIADGLDRIVAAWRAGDVDSLETELMQSMRDQPELYDRILVQRNRNWTRQIVGLANGREDVLVVVGALHLVGDDSVIRMLDAAGYPAKQQR